MHKHFNATLLSLLCALCAGPTLAQQAQQGAPASASLPKVQAEVRKVDTSAQKITLRHGPITNLNMPPMTMVFQVRNPALLESVTAGDKVLFSAEQQQGAYIVTHIEKAAP